MKLAILISSFLLTISCTQKESNPEPSSQTKAVAEYQDINVSEFNTKYSEPDSNVVILDVRTDREVQAGAIPNSIAIDFMSSDFKSKASQLDPSKTYIVYCQSGGRSAAASKIMTQELGFKDVKNLEGGYSTWVEEEN